MVTELKKKYEFAVEIVKKTDPALSQEASRLKFPALELDGQVLFQGSDIGREELEREILKRKPEESL